MKLVIESIDDRDAALLAVYEYDVAHGRIARPTVAWDHVHRVKADDLPNDARPA